MNVLRKMLLGLLSILFIVLLFTAAFDIGFVRITTHPQNVKKLVSESGIYDSIIPSFLEQTKTINTSAGTIVVTDPAILKAANQAITPQFIQQNTEAAIDSVYHWLDGATQQPDFKINLADAKANFANSIAGIAVQKAAALPLCTTAQTTVIIQSGQFDVFSATCLPKGYTAAQVGDQVKSSIAGSDEVLDKTTISADTIKNGDSNMSVFQDQLKNAPKAYQRAKMTPIILIVLTILTGLGIIFLSSSWPKGLRRAGVSLLVVGIIMLAFSYSFPRAINTQAIPKIKIDNVQIQKDVRKLVVDLTKQIDNNYWFFGGLYAILGAGAITLGETFRRRGGHPVYVTDAKKTPNPPAAEPEPMQVKQPAKPKPKKIKIQ